MNPMNDDEQALSRALHGKVDHMNDAPLGLDDVQGAAGTVRRRRRIAAGAGLAAAAVIIVPTAIVAAGGLGRDDPAPGPVASSTTATTEPSGSAHGDADGRDRPRDPRPDRDPALRRVRPRRPAPRPRSTGATGGDVHRADGSVVAGVLPPTTDGFAPMGSGWVVATRDDEGGGYAQWIPASGMSTAQVYDLDGDLATSLRRRGGRVGRARRRRPRHPERAARRTSTMPPITAPAPTTPWPSPARTARRAAPPTPGARSSSTPSASSTRSWASTSHGFADRYDEDDPAADRLVRRRATPASPSSATT